MGSFKNRQYAEDLTAKLKSQNYPAKIMKGENGMYRVSIKSFANYNEAVIAKKSIQNQNKYASVWLFDIN